MFPFLSVLCAMIGVLVLFLLVVVTTRVHSAMAGVADERSLPPPPPPPERKSPASEKVDAGTYEALQKQLEDLTLRLAQRQQEHAELERLEIELAELIATKQDAVAIKQGDEDFVDGASLEPKEDVEMVELENQGLTKRPRFLEVRADELIIHPEGTRCPLADVERNDSAVRNYFQQLHERREKEYLLMLLHPGAAPAFQKLTQLLLTQYSDLDIGWEPFSPGWLLVDQELKQQEPEAAP